MTNKKTSIASPSQIQLEPGKIYSWCTCGMSEKIILCDGSHKNIEGMPFKSLKFEVAEAGQYWLCNCKQTKNPPYCDGSHKNITDL